MFEWYASLACDSVMFDLFLRTWYHPRPFRIKFAAVNHRHDCHTTMSSAVHPCSDMLILDRFQMVQSHLDHKLLLRGDIRHTVWLYINCYLRADIDDRFGMGLKWDW